MTRKILLRVGLIIIKIRKKNFLKKYIGHIGHTSPRLLTGVRVSGLYVSSPGMGKIPSRPIHVEQRIRQALGGSGCVR